VLFTSRDSIGRQRDDPVAADDDADKNTNGKTDVA
jgi:hypothetical protein